MKCPKCNATDVMTERRPDGNSVCCQCKYQDKTKLFCNVPKEPVYEYQWLYSIHGIYLTSEHYKTEEDFRRQYPSTITVICRIEGSRTEVGE